MHLLQLEVAFPDLRLKRIVHRVVSDLFRRIEDFDVQPDEFWSAMAYLSRLGQANEVGLLVPGLGLETFLDMRLDQAEQKAGLEGGTPRTIEGPLWIADAPLSKGEARLDDGTEQGEVLFMEGQVRDVNGKPVAGAVIDVWHANTKGGYSFFDPAQSKYNLRRRIETDAQGRYSSFKRQGNGASALHRHAAMMAGRRRPQRPSRAQRIGPPAKEWMQLSCPQRWLRYRFRGSRR